MMASMGAVDENTIIVTTVHDCQVNVKTQGLQQIDLLKVTKVYVSYTVDRIFNAVFQVTDIPDTLIENHDIVVDYIVTPTKVIECEHRKKPSGIIWSKITRDKLQQVIHFRMNALNIKIRRCYSFLD